MSWMNRFEKEKPLHPLTTIGIGGKALYFIEVRTIADMQSLLQYCKESRLPFFILGKGSNLIFDDKGFNGLVIGNRISFVENPYEGCWHVGAGYSFSLLGTQTARLGWTGLEFASGIPGSVGGAVFMNAGANGVETCDTLFSVEFVHEDGSYQLLHKEELSFSYRFSSFQQKKGAIVGATFQLNQSSEARQKQKDLIHYRRKTQPYGEKSAGCIFRNPSCANAGAIIDKCGLKGKSVGGAIVSDMHANFIVNQGGATSKDIVNLIDLIVQEVKLQSGLDLHPEVRFIPQDEK